ncbi:hypothetical protein [Streptomyces sp. NPDC002587]
MGMLRFLPAGLGTPADPSADSPIQLHSGRGGGRAADAGGSSRERPCRAAVNKESRRILAKTRIRRD